MLTRRDAAHATHLVGQALGLSKWPNLKSSHGIGSRRTERQAKIVPAQCTPKFWYMGRVNKGNVAPRA